MNFLFSHSTHFFLKNLILLNFLRHGSQLILYKLKLSREYIISIINSIINFSNFLCKLVHRVQLNKSLSFYCLFLQIVWCFGEVISRFWDDRVPPRHSTEFWKGGPMRDQVVVNLATLAVATGLGLVIHRKTLSTDRVNVFLVDLTEIMLVTHSIVLWRSWHWGKTIHTTIVTLSLVNAFLVETNSILRFLGARRIINSFMFWSFIWLFSQRMVIRILHI